MIVKKIPLQSFLPCYLIEQEIYPTRSVFSSELFENRWKWKWSKHFLRVYGKTFSIQSIPVRAFLKKKMSTPPHDWWVPRTSYPEGETGQTSLGGWHRHLKFDISHFRFSLGPLLAMPRKAEWKSNWIWVNSTQKRDFRESQNHVPKSQNGGYYWQKTLAPLYWCPFRTAQQKTYF